MLRYSTKDPKTYSMKQTFFLGLLLLTTSFLFAQPDALLNAKEAERIERVLASDEMRGRRARTPDIDRAAEFIAAEFKKAGLQPVKANSYLQSFSLMAAKPVKIKAETGDREMDINNVMVVTTKPELKVDEKSGYEIQRIAAGESLGPKARSIIRSGKNTVVFVDTSFAKNFSRLTSLRSQLWEMENSVIFFLGNQASSFKVNAAHEFEKANYANVVGVLPGKSRKEEYVIFSAHYDHLGIGKPVNGDSIYNGANDDAAGTTAVIMLANYFAALKNNERTLVFAAFTAEESGGFGSQYFSRQYDPGKVVAMFNIEMIGTESKWGKNSAYITGYDKTDMGAILEKNLEGTGFTFHPDPYTAMQLFYRSDNATLARLGVPAHTISTSKMDSEPNYHKVSDEVATLDLENMAMIIRSIALSAKSIIAGKDTPTRVKVEELR